MPLARGKCPRHPIRSAPGHGQVPATPHPKCAWPWASARNTPSEVRLARGKCPRLPIRRAPGHGQVPPTPHPKCPPGVVGARDTPIRSGPPKIPTHPPKWRSVLSPRKPPLTHPPNGPNVTRVEMPMLSCFNMLLAVKCYVTLHVSLVSGKSGILDGNFVNVLR